MWFRWHQKKNDTAKNYQIRGYLGTFGVISPVTNPFCDTCNRMRLTADGKIKNCLFSTSECDLLTQLRQGKDIRESIKNNILAKKKERGGMVSFTSKGAEDLYFKNRTMTAIGG